MDTLEADKMTSGMIRTNQPRGDSPPPLADMLEELGRRGHMLEGYVERLAEQLSPMLRPSSPTESRPGFNRNPEFSDLGNAVLGQMQHLEDLAARLGDLQNRLQL